MDATETAHLQRLASDKVIDINCTDLNGFTPLLVLCRNNRSNSLYPSLKALLRREDIDIKCSSVHSPVSPLILLCRYYPLGDLIDSVRLLIQRGVAVDLKDKDGRDSLYLLCQYYPGECLIDIARLLVYHMVQLDTVLNYEYVLRFRKLFQESEILKKLLQSLRDGHRGTLFKPNQVNILHSLLLLFYHLF